MPWPALAHLTPDDARAIALYLQSLPPVKNAVPGPFKAGEHAERALRLRRDPDRAIHGLPRPIADGPKSDDRASSQPMRVRIDLSAARDRQ